MREIFPRPEDRLAHVEGPDLMRSRPGPGPDGRKGELQILLCGSDAGALDALSRMLAKAAPFAIPHQVGREKGLHAFADAAMQSELVLIRLDANEGCDDQVRHQLAMARCIGLRDAVIAVDGMERTGWDRAAFESIAGAMRPVSEWLGFRSLLVTPVSIASDEGVAPWRFGPTLVEHLQGIAANADSTRDPMRFCVRKTVAGDDGVLCAGALAGGGVRLGDTLLVARSGRQAAVSRLLVSGKEVERVAGRREACIGFAMDAGVEAGDVLAPTGHVPECADQFAAHLVWLGEAPLLPGRFYDLEIGFRTVRASVTALKHRLSIEKLDLQAARTLRKGEIGLCNIAAEAAVALGASPHAPSPDGFVLRDSASGRALALGTVDYGLRRSHNLRYQVLDVSKQTRAALKGQKPCVVWFTGLSGAGKSTLANHVEAMLAAHGRHTYLMDGDNIRHGLNKDLGFTSADRVENIRRIGEVSKLFVDAGLIVLCAFISPFRAERAQVRGLLGDDEFIEVFVDAPLSVCEARDPKGLYAKSRAGLLPNFTGIDSPYERPENPDLVLDTASSSVDALAERVLALLAARGRLRSG